MSQFLLFLIYCVASYQISSLFLFPLLSLNMFILFSSLIFHCISAYVIFILLCMLSSDILYRFMLASPTVTFESLTNV